MALPFDESLTLCQVTSTTIPLGPSVASRHNENEDRFMTSGMRTVIYPVRDLAQAKKLYGKLLGVAPSMDEAYYVGFSVAGQDVGLDPHGHS